MLNGHPEVFCIHALRYCVDVNDGIAGRLDDVQVLSAVERMGAGLRLAGEVHGLARTSVPQLQGQVRQTLSLRRTGARAGAAAAVAACTVRHAQLLAEGVAQHGVCRLPGGLPRVAGQVRSYERLMFVHAVNMLNAVLEEQELFPLYRLEDLSTNPTALHGFIDHLSGGCIDVDDAFLAWAQKSGIAEFACGARWQGPRPFEDWQLDVIRAILRPEAVEAYQGLGYEIPDDWIEPPVVRAVAAA